MSDNYFQDRANKEKRPIYVGPDNVKGGSHWIYPQEKTIRPCPGLLPPEHCVLDIGHEGSCVSGNTGSHVPPATFEDWYRNWMPSTSISGHIQDLRDAFAAGQESVESQTKEEKHPGEPAEPKEPRCP